MYEDSDGDQHETIVEVVMKFDYGAEKIVVEIRTQVEVLNYTMVDIALCDIGKGVSNLKEERTVVARKGRTTSLPFWTASNLAVTL